jgi:Flp pilus assembly protein TadG
VSPGPANPLEGVPVKADRERGSAAIEFAVVLPVMIWLLFGIIQLGWLFHAWVVLDGASRQGARDMSIHNNVSDAKDAAVDDMPSLNLTPSDVTVEVDDVVNGSCGPGKFVAVSITYTSPMPSVVPGIPSTITRKGVAQCVG